MSPSGAKKRKAPPDGYVCKACESSGHWIYECAEYASKKQKRTPAEAAVPARSGEDLVNCACGKRCKKRRGFVEGRGPRSFWICGFKKAKCRFSVDTEEYDEEKAQKLRRNGTKVNGRYVQRAAKRDAKRKLFISGIPFGADVAERLGSFFEDHDVAPPKRVVPLKGDGGAGRFTGQAYVEFAEVADATAALALSGEKLGDRWLEISAADPENREKAKKTNAAENPKGDGDANKDGAADEEEGTSDDDDEKDDDDDDDDDDVEEDGDDDGDDCEDSDDADDDDEESGDDDDEDIYAVAKSKKK